MGTSRIALVLFALVAVLMLGVAGCGGGVAATDGASIYKSVACGSCHVLTAANSTGTAGPNLDESKMTEAQMVERITNGGKTMRPFKNQLTAEQINKVAAYVADSRDKQ